MSAGRSFVEGIQKLQPLSARSPTTEGGDEIFRMDVISEWTWFPNGRDYPSA
ncbi:hypothetical protein K443DRAFT_14436 [Laccaria amethystina LaAM-08-1]|uniref:Uncharacterized protein n=1 Tax=Laccaria amethystina LaAM-08-1 TaxID=1095629 RepID=A0A0C9WT47_9AGAR|nr:hypothetical protein K443DRAFT_14436 [Laccaria amethystina LaAM-08-1]